MGGNNPEIFISNNVVATYPTHSSLWKARTPRNETGGFQNHELVMTTSNLLSLQKGLRKPEGGLSAQPKQFQPKMFHTGEGKCPVTLLLIASTRERTRAKHVFT